MAWYTLTGHDTTGPRGTSIPAASPPAAARIRVQQVTSRSGIGGNYLRRRGAGATSSRIGSGVASQVAAYVGSSGIGTCKPGATNTGIAGSGSPTATVSTYTVRGGPASNPARVSG